jgi:hypothetical protein
MEDSVLSGFKTAMQWLLAIAAVITAIWLSTLVLPMKVIGQSFICLFAGWFLGLLFFYFAAHSGLTPKVTIGVNLSVLLLAVGIESFIYFDSGGSRPILLISAIIGSVLELVRSSNAKAVWWNGYVRQHGRNPDGFNVPDIFRPS